MLWFIFFLEIVSAEASQMLRLSSNTHFSSSCSLLPVPYFQIKYDFMRDWWCFNGILIATLSPLPLCLQVFGPTWTWQAVGKAGTRWGPEDACSSLCECVEVKTALSSLSYFMIHVKKKKKVVTLKDSQLCSSFNFWSAQVANCSWRLQKEKQKCLIWLLTSQMFFFLNTFS